MIQTHVFGACEKFLIARVRARPSALNVINTQLVQFPCNEDFVVHGERDGFALRAIPESGIECLNAHGCYSVKGRASRKARPGCCWLKPRLLLWTSSGTSSSCEAPLPPVRSADRAAIHAWR